MRRKTIPFYRFPCHPATSFSASACRVFGSEQCPGHRGASIAVGHLRFATVLPAAPPPITSSLIILS